MNIKNYTTEVPANRSIENINKLLIDFGASNIMSEIENARVKSISFRLLVDNVPFAFKLPADVQACYLWLKKKKPNGKDAAILAQAERIAWKHQHEWLQIQLTGIELAQMEKIQALLPYSLNPVTGETYYQTLKDKKFTNLLNNG
jgi:hypothetical protein